MKYEIRMEKLLAFLVLFKISYVCAEIAGLYFITMLLIGALIGAAIGGTIAGVSAYQDGARGWNLVGSIAGGAVLGGVIGGATDAFVGLGMAAGAGFGGAAFAYAGAGAVAVATNVGVIAGGAVAVLGLNIVCSQWNPGSWPGDDPTQPPGDGFIWRGPGEVGSRMGEWYNPKTGDQLHPDIMHPPGKPPHWGWRNKALKILKDIFRP